MIRTPRVLPILVLMAGIMAIAAAVVVIPTIESDQSPQIASHSEQVALLEALFEPEVDVGLHVLLVERPLVPCEVPSPGSYCHTLATPADPQSHTSQMLRVLASIPNTPPLQPTVARLNRVPIDEVPHPFEENYSPVSAAATSYAVVSGDRAVMLVRRFGSCIGGDDVVRFVRASERWIMIAQEFAASRPGWQ